MCPPGVDQTTRTRQQWNILAPLKNERYDITDDCTNKREYSTGLAYFLDGDYTWDAFDKLVCGRVTDAGDVAAILSKCSQRKTAANPSMLETMPNELLAMLFSSESLALEDILALGLCSKSLWQHCLSYFKFSMSTGPWVKTPLLCTGTYLTDLPRAVHEMEPSLKQREEEWRARRVSRGHGMLGGPGMCPARDWNWNAIGSFKESSKSFAELCRAAFDSLLSSDSHGIAPHDQKILRQTLERIFSTSKAKSGSQWLLRNHTTCQFAHLKSAANGAQEQLLHVKGSSKLSLDKALLIRISWKAYHRSSDLTPAARSLSGDWAGHRFDIVSGHEAGLRSVAGWEDVTGGLVRAGKA